MRLTHDAGLGVACIYERYGGTAGTESENSGGQGLPASSRHPRGAIRRHHRLPAAPWYCHRDRSKRSGVGTPRRQPPAVRRAATSDRPVHQGQACLDQWLVFWRPCSRRAREKNPGAKAVTIGALIWCRKIFRPGSFKRIRLPLLDGSHLKCQP